MSFGKKSNNTQQTTPQPTFTRTDSPQTQPITRVANSAEAQDRMATNNSASALLAQDDEEMQRRRNGSTVLSTY